MNRTYDPLSRAGERRALDLGTAERVLGTRTGAARDSSRRAPLPESQAGSVPSTDIFCTYYDMKYSQV
ncbi:hypothetical protein P7K49_007448 [Saguinus oedipus]|uniref:Uncharacterized protein n=1 Tax=Saguinus oedipus TaxID=9490 RepID=A0ABQ9VYG9_SAGOE|nr:hypothetical protein P7K49_007448 [Saguinus oedipus]